MRYTGTLTGADGSTIIVDLNVRFFSDSHKVADVALELKEPTKPDETGATTTTQGA
jgi:hypothetical protein